MRRAAFCGLNRSLGMPLTPNGSSWPIWSANAVLASVSENDLEALRPNLRSTHLDAGRLLFDFADEIQSIYFPVSCLIALFAQMRSGQAVACTTRGRDGAIGYIEAVGSGRSSSQARVQIGGTALCLPASRYRELYDRSAEFRRNMNRRAQLMMMEARQSAACYAGHLASERLARIILECYRHTGARRLRLTHELLSDLTGLGRTSISRCINEYQAEGLLTNSRGTIALCDVPGLEQRACECYVTVRDARREILSELDQLRSWAPSV